jgi:hypothetical protein
MPASTPSPASAAVQTGQLKRARDLPLPLLYGIRPDRNVGDACQLKEKLDHAIDA